MAPLQVPMVANTMSSAGDSLIAFIRLMVQNELLIPPEQRILDHGLIQAALHETKVGLADGAFQLYEMLLGNLNAKSEPWLLSLRTSNPVDRDYPREPAIHLAELIWQYIEARDDLYNFQPPNELLTVCVSGNLCVLDVLTLCMPGRSRFQVIGLGLQNGTPSECAVQPKEISSL